MEASPRIIKVKKIPMESTWADELNVPAMPAPAPRWLAGRLFMMPVWFGAMNMPMPTELKKISTAKPR